MKPYECGGVSKSEKKWFKWLEECEVIVGGRWLTLTITVIFMTFIVMVAHHKKPPKN